MEHNSKETIKKILAQDSGFTQHLDSDFGRAVAEAERCLPTRMHGWLSNEVLDIMRLACRDYRGFSKALRDEARNCGYVRATEKNYGFNISCLYYDEIHQEVDKLFPEKFVFCRDAKLSIHTVSRFKNMFIAAMLACPVTKTNIF